MTQGMLKPSSLLERMNLFASPMLSRRGAGSYTSTEKRPVYGALSSCILCARLFQASFFEKLIPLFLDRALVPEHCLGGAES